MEIAGVTVAFTSILLLISKGVSMGLALLVGTLVAGFLLPMGLSDFVVSVFQGLLNPLAIQLIIAVSFISGLGHIMKETKDLNLMIDSLIGIFKNAKILSPLLPAIIGTLNAPGGAIISAPMVDESGKKLELNAVDKAAINLFYRHIIFWVYPLYSSTIMASELLGIRKIEIIRYNVLIMVVGLIVAYFTYFGGKHTGNQQQDNNGNGIVNNLREFFVGFSPILLSIVLVVVVDLPFYLAVIAGVILALVRKLPEKNSYSALGQRVKNLFTSWINYKLVIIIIGVMAFKAVIESSGVVDILSTHLINFGIPLPILVLVVSFITAYVTGVHMAATGLLVVLFSPMIPAVAMGPYLSLLFTAVIIGYLISPLHLCLVLSNEYFDVGLGAVYKRLTWPLVAMLVTALVQVLILV